MRQSNFRTKLTALMFLLLLSMQGSLTWAQSPLEPLVGSWYFYELFYGGAHQPPLNPDLNLYFEFTNQGESHLWWSRNNQTGFCERKGQYRIENGYLIDHIVWVNPENAMECGRDTDMQLGRTSETPIEIIDDKLWIHLPLGDEQLSMIFRRQEPVYPTQNSSQ